MRKTLIFVLSLALCSSGFSQDNNTGPARRKSRGEAAGYSSRNATVLSMMGWGVGIAVGIAAICALIDNNAGSTSFH
jgi:hypothetical protein